MNQLDITSGITATIISSVIFLAAMILGHVRCPGPKRPVYQYIFAGIWGVLFIATLAMGFVKSSKTGFPFWIEVSQNLPIYLGGAVYCFFSKGWLKTSIFKKILRAVLIAILALMPANILGNIMIVQSGEIGLTIVIELVCAVALIAMSNNTDIGINTSNDKVVTFKSTRK